MYLLLTLIPERLGGSHPPAFSPWRACISFPLARTLISAHRSFAAFPDRILIASRPRNTTFPVHCSCVDIDTPGAPWDKQELIGTFECTLGDIVGSKGSRLMGRLKNPKYPGR